MRYNAPSFGSSTEQQQQIATVGQHYAAHYPLAGVKYVVNLHWRAYALQVVRPGEADLLREQVPMRCKAYIVKHLGRASFFILS